MKHSRVYQLNSPERSFMESSELLPLKVTIHASFIEAKKFYDEDNGLHLFEAEESLDLPNLANGLRNIVTGEPGMGKTTLMNELKAIFDKRGFNTETVLLKRGDCVSLIDAFLVKSVENQKALFLDGLDEVGGNELDTVVGKIKSVSESHPEIIIYLSSRWNFIKKNPAIFSLGYRFFTISPLSKRSVRSKLISMGHAEVDVDSLLNSFVAFNHGYLVIQTPRYLNCFIEFMKDKSIKDIKTISRHELFEHFIYSKLILEDEKLKSEKRTIIKRLLEKLALVMEIYQTNELKKDEFMTFLDDLDSDLKTHVLAQIPLETLFDCSILKNDVGLEKIEFDNTEFQEYLAAKELSRFVDTQKAASELAIDPDIRQIQPSWFNTLSFLVDIDSKILDPLMDFSGIKNEFRVIDESFFSFLGRLNTETLSPDLKRRVFADVFEYHQRVKQWLPGQVAISLAKCFDQTQVSILKDYANKTDFIDDEERVVQLGNLGYVVGALFEVNSAVILNEKAYWKDLLIKLVGKKNDGTVLQRHALEALAKFRDPSVIDLLPNLVEGEELVASAQLSLCTEVNPDHKKSVQYFIEATKKNIFYGKYGLFELSKPESIKVFLKALATDEVFRFKFLDDHLDSKAADEMIKRIDSVFDDEISELIDKVILSALQGHHSYQGARSNFLAKIFRLKKEKVASFINNVIVSLSNCTDKSICFFSAQPLFEKTLDELDVPAFISTMTTANEKNTALNVLISIKITRGSEGDGIYEAGRSSFPQEYSDWEKRRLTEPQTDESEKKYKEFQHALQPEPKKYRDDVFDFFVRNQKILESRITDDDKKRLRELIKGSVFSIIDPVDFVARTTAQTIDSRILLFGPALLAAEILGMNVNEDRQRIINFIPFAHHEHLDAIFKLVTGITATELTFVLEIYKNKHSDPLRYPPTNLVNLAKEYFLVNTVPILKGFVFEADYDFFCRRSALEVVDLLTPDPIFLENVFTKYKDSSIDSERLLAMVSNGLLISSHENSEAIQWRIEEVIKRVAPFIRAKGVHSVSELENELSHEMKFAKPLMNLSAIQYIDQYLHLLSESVKIWNKGEEHHEYANYIWNIIYSYFEKLASKGSYDPLRKLEDAVLKLKDQPGLNWFSARIPNLRRLYLTHISKPRNVSTAIKKYNQLKDRERNIILDSESLFQELQDAINTDLRKWIEGEGAYELILGDKVFDSKHQEYEGLIQKTIKTQIENILLRRNFKTMDIDREVQLLDGKKVDFMVRYGFIGPIVLETKLGNHKDLQGAKLEQKASYKSMQRYMDGYGATKGIFLIIENTAKSRFKVVKQAYEQIPGVQVLSIDCKSGIQGVKKGKGSKKNIPKGRSGAVKKGAPKKRVNV